MESVQLDKKFEILNDHYKDTFSILKESIRLRDKLTVFVIAVLTLMIMYTFWPTDAATLLSQISTKQMGFAVNVREGFLGCILWFSLLAIVIRYTQVTVYIERQYAYVHILEEELRKYYDNKTVFTREGHSYLNDYPKYSNWVCFLYTKIFPIALLLIVIAKIICEWISLWNIISLPLVINSVIAINIMISVTLYMLFMYEQQFPKINK